MTTATVQTDLIKAIIKTQKPQSIMQVGLGEQPNMLALCEALNQQDDEASITVIESNLDLDPACSATLAALQEVDLDQLVECLSTSADQVLPDLYFQELSYDMAVLNPCATFEETFVAFYYIDKMLPQNALILINQADTPIMRKLCRQMITGMEYAVDRCAETQSDMPKIEKIIREQYSRVPAFIKNRIEDVIHPQIVISDEELGLFGPLISLKKQRKSASPAFEVDEMLEAIG